MARLPLVGRESVPEELQGAYDKVVSLCGGAIGPGPTQMLINSPALAVHTRALTNYMWQESPLPDRIKQLAVLAVTHALDCQYAWNAHFIHGKEAGLSDALLEALCNDTPLPAVPSDEAATINYAREFFSTHKVSQETFQAALDEFGPLLLADLTALMGYYAMVSFVLIAFDYS